MVKLLEPFETITRQLSGEKYPILNMVHPYMCMLKRMFAPRNNENETLNSYLELVYGPLIPENGSENVEDETSDISDSSSISSDDDFLTAGNQHAHYQQRRSQGCERDCDGNCGCGRRYGYGHRCEHGRGCGYGHTSR